MIGVVGISYKSAPLLLREKVGEALSKLQKTEKNFVFLHTCHRAEWYFSSPLPTKTHELITQHIRLEAGDDATLHLFSFFGEECVYHLEKVVSGLDSLFLGETEIQGQVKVAYENQKTSKELPKELHTLFQKALHTGKVLRSMMQTPTCFLQNEVAKKVLETEAKKTLFIGTSSLNCSIASLLLKKNIDVTFTNRTEERASKTACEMGTHVLPWDSLKTLWCEFPCVIAATRTPSYIIKKEHVHCSLKNQLLIDLGVPRNIDPSLGTTKTLLNIESFIPESSSSNNHSLESTLSLRSKRDFLAINDL